MSNNNLNKKLLNEKINLIKENKKLKEKLKNLELENKFIREETVDKLEKLEKHLENFYKKNIEIKNDKTLTDSCFKLSHIFLRFDKRNIPLKLNYKRSFGTTYTYTGFFENYNIGLNNEKIKEKTFSKFNISVFFYFNKKNNHLYVSVEGQIKEKNNFIKYLFATKDEEKEFQKYKYIACETFSWPFIHHITLKDNELNKIDEIKVKIMKNNQKF
jgi:hypothetical protein